MATAQVKKQQQNAPNNSQSEAIQNGFSAFMASAKKLIQQGVSLFALIERVWASEDFPILKPSQVVLSQKKLKFVDVDSVNQTSILRNVFLTNNEHEVAFAVINTSQEFSHHTYTSIHHNEPSISSIITLRS